MFTTKGKAVFAMVGALMHTKLVKLRLQQLKQFTLILFL